MGGIKIAGAALVLMTLAACDNGGAAGDAPANTGVGDSPRAAALPETDAWIGKWIGVEGLVLNIGRGDVPGRYRLGVTLLDGTNVYEGVGEGAVIRFERGGRAETIRHATGEETGLKWLAGKRNCLTIRPGEGFCRD